MLIWFCFHIHVGWTRSRPPQPSSVLLGPGGLSPLLIPSTTSYTASDAHQPVPPATPPPYSYRQRSRSRSKQTPISSFGYANYNYSNTPLRPLCPPSKPRLPLQCHRVKAGPHRSSLRLRGTPHKARQMLPSISVQTRTSRSGQARASAWVLASSQRARPASMPSIGTAKYGQSIFPTPTPRNAVLTTSIYVYHYCRPPSTFYKMCLGCAISDKTASDPCVTRCGHLFCWSHLREVCFSTCSACQDTNVPHPRVSFILAPDCLICHMSDM